MNTSKLLGILSICIAAFSPITGVILSIVGLTIKKEERYTKLNVLGLVLSILSFCFAFIVSYGM
jgi:uncharacterized membrane protein